MAEPFIGQIVLFAGCYYPEGWAPCFGQIINIQDNTPLFAVISNTYGGDGKTTFQLPDLRGRTPIGTGELTGSPNIPSGGLGGQASVALTLANIPAHSHTLNICSTDANSSSPQGAYLATAVDTGGGSANLIYSDKPNGTANAGAIGPAGGGANGSIQPIPTMPPYIGMNYIIALTGTFPSASSEYTASFVPKNPGAPNPPKLTV